MRICGDRREGWKGGGGGVVTVRMCVGRVCR